MPKIKDICKACEVSFSAEGPISDEALERVRLLLEEIRPSDVGLKEEAHLARSWISPSRAPNGRRGRSGSNQRTPPKYLHIYQCESFSVGIFCMPPSSIFPLHNHPGMTVLTKLLYGTLHVESYDWIDVTDQMDKLKENSAVELAARPAKLVRNSEMSAPETTVLFPNRGGNLHSFRAITPCAFLDILTPPYSSEKGRDCSYFRKASIKEPPVVLPSEVSASEVVWLEELEDHQPPDGFAVAIGQYKGPVIRK